MDYEQLKSELAAIVEMLPGPMEGSYANVDDLVSSLRLRVKYLLFEAEAARRENNYLRDMLKGKDDGMHQPMG